MIGKRVDVRLTQRKVDILDHHEHVVLHSRRSTLGGHSTPRKHIPKAHRRHGGMNPEYLILRAGRVSHHAVILVERLIMGVSPVSEFVDDLFNTKAAGQLQTKQTGTGN